MANKLFHNNATGKEKRKFSKKIIKYLVFFFAFLFICFVLTPAIIDYFQRKNFKSFDLKDLAEQELQIQQIDFKKFFVFGTENKGNPGSFFDELQVYYVSGHAIISFVDINALEISSEDSDYKNKICRIKYKADKENPFKVTIIIDENKTYKVVNFESRTIKLKNFEIDLITPELTQAQIVARIKDNLQKEFEKQILPKTKNPNELEKDKLYQAFISRLEELIIEIEPKWKSVQVEFDRKEKK